MFAVPYDEIRELQLAGDAVPLRRRSGRRCSCSTGSPSATASTASTTSPTAAACCTRRTSTSRTSSAWLIDQEYARLTNWLRQLTDARPLRRRRRRRRLARRVVHTPGGGDRPPAVPFVVDVREAVVRPARRRRVDAAIRVARLRERGRRHRRRSRAHLAGGRSVHLHLLPPRAQRGDPDALRLVHPGAHRSRRHPPRARADAPLRRAELRPHGARGPPAVRAAHRRSHVDATPQRLLERRTELGALLEGTTDERIDRSSPRPPTGSRGQRCVVGRRVADDGRRRRGTSLAARSSPGLRPVVVRHLGRRREGPRPARQRLRHGDRLDRRRRALEEGYGMSELMGINAEVLGRQLPPQPVARALRARRRRPSSRSRRSAASPAGWPASTSWRARTGAGTSAPTW